MHSQYTPEPSTNSEMIYIRLLSARNYIQLCIGKVNQTDVLQKLIPNPILLMQVLKMRL